MGEIKQWIEEHPYLTGGTVLGILVLYLLLSSSSSSSNQTASNGVGGTGLSSSDYTSLQEAQIQTGAQLQAQQNAATEQGNEYSAELAATQINADATTQANALAAQVQLQNILTAGQTTQGQTAEQLALGVNTNATNLAGAQAQIGGQVQLAGISAQENDYGEGVQAQTLESEYASAVQSQGIVSQAQTDQAQINANTQLGIANYAAQIGLGQIGEQENATNVSGQVSLAGINAQAGVENNEITTQGQEYNTGETTSLAALLAQLGLQQSEVTSGENLVASGALNKGGSGGANQVSFLSTLFGGGGGAPTPTNSGFGITLPGIGAIGVQNP